MLQQSSTKLLQMVTLHLFYLVGVVAMVYVLVLHNNNIDESLTTAVVIMGIIFYIEKDVENCESDDNSQLYYYEFG